MNKDELRLQAKLHLERTPLSDTDGEDAAGIFIKTIPIHAGDVVAAYWPLGKEFDVRPIIAEAMTKGASIALPVARHENRVMLFSRWDGKSELVKGAFGIYVPEVPEYIEPDIIIVPLLAFDRKGNRLGKGAGHYDATLEHIRARKKILAVGVAYTEQAVLFTLPAEPHDQKLDLIITPAGAQDFRD